MRNKIFTKIIITTLLITFLTFNVGKVTRVSAVGTTIAASAAAALCAVGIVYCSYMALTGASVHVPDAVDDIADWLTDMGTKVVQFPSGRAAYEEIYPHMLSLNPATTLIHDFLDSEVWTWTADKIKEWTNDFSSTDVIQNIASFEQYLEVVQPTTNWNYPFTLTPYSGENVQVFGSYGTSSSTISQLQQTYTFDVPAGPRFIGFYTNDGGTHAFHSYGNHVYRNIQHSNGTFNVQELVNDTWTTIYNVDICTRLKIGTYIYYYLIPYYSSSHPYQYNAMQGITRNPIDTTTYPQCLDAPIYVEATGETIEVIPRENTVVITNPQWPTLPPEDDNKPVIPYVQSPFDPSWIDPVTGNPGGGNWGLPLGNLLDLLEELAGALMEIGAIGELINQFKNLISGQTGDEYYIYYDDSDNDYYQYYTITNFGDNIYNYNIDVSEVDKQLPVDLNNIQKYSNNRYLEQIKQSAVNGSSIVRDFAVFWYDVDPEVTYIILGCCILILIGAFTGKLGHS